MMIFLFCRHREALAVGQGEFMIGSLHINDFLWRRNIVVKDCYTTRRTDVVAQTSFGDRHITTAGNPLGVIHSIIIIERRSIGGTPAILPFNRRAAEIGTPWNSGAGFRDLRIKRRCPNRL